MLMLSQLGLRESMLVSGTIAQAAGNAAQLAPLTPMALKAQSALAEDGQPLFQLADAVRPGAAVKSPIAVSFDRGAADRTGQIEATVDGHVVMKRRHLFGKSAMRAFPQPLGPIDQRRSRRAAQRFDFGIGQ